jgi:hypothetical protein
MLILKGKSQRHFVIKNSSNESNTASNRKKSKPPLVVVDENRELSSELIQAEQFPVTNSTSMRLGAVVRGRQYVYGIIR